MNVWLQKILPQHLLSGFIGWLGNCQVGFFKNAMIRYFIRKYGVNMKEAVFETAEDYDCFNSFFTRYLKPEVRDFNKSDQCVLSPADGFVSEGGSIHEGCLLQAKGAHYSLTALLASQRAADLFTDGQFMTVYLAPKDYHRVHMPFSGKLISMTYVPGSLFSVNEATAAEIPGLFAKNERVLCLFETELGFMSVILVGALIVGSIYTTWHGCVTPSRARHIAEWDYEPQNKYYHRGEELGHFQMGSTVIVLFQKNAVTPLASDRVKSPVMLGDIILEANNS